MKIYKIHELQVSEWKGSKGVANLEEILNEYAAKGWLLKQVTEVSRPGVFSSEAKSIMIIFEKEGTSE